jgi:hypothetical protein
MHAHRYFVKALDSGDQRATLPLSAFKVIYEIEEQVRGKPPDEVLAARLEKTELVYRELISWCEKYEPHEPPNSPTGKAIRYLLNNCDALTRFIYDPRIPPDNGVVERLHVRTALTRKNYLFAGSDAGAPGGDCLYDPRLLHAGGREPGRVSGRCAAAAGGEDTAGGRGRADAGGVEGLAVALTGTG